MGLIEVVVCRCSGDVVVRLACSVCKTGFCLDLGSYAFPVGYKKLVNWWPAILFL